MFAKARLKELDDVKRMVVLQSDIHRGLLQIESTALCERFARFDAARAKLKTHRPLLVAVALFGGFLATRRWPVLAARLRSVVFRKSTVATS